VLAEENIQYVTAYLFLFDSMNRQSLQINVSALCQTVICLWNCAWHLFGLMNRS